MRKLQRHEFPVLPCGSLSLRTGKNRYFNVLDDWKRGDSHLTLFKQDIVSWRPDAQVETRYRVVAGWGAVRGAGGMPDQVGLAHDQTHRTIGDPLSPWEKVCEVPNTRHGLADLSSVLRERRARRTNSVAMCVLK